MIRKRQWPNLLLPMAIPVFAGGLVSMLLVLAVPVTRPSHTPHATVFHPEIGQITLPDPSPEIGSAVIEADPFAGDRKAPPRRTRTAAAGRQAAIGTGTPPAAGRLALVGLLTDPSGPIAVLRDRTSGETALLRKGESFHGLRLTKVEDLSVQLEGAGGKALTLTLSFRKTQSSMTAPAPRTVPRAQLRPRRPHPVTGTGQGARTVSPAATVGAPAPRRGGFGRPKPARRFQARSRDVRTWQRKLEDYGIAGDSRRPVPPQEEGTAAPKDPSDPSP
ncbi:MAG: hypothetical protein D6740_12640 [Alphaproteobacteria bacterium]|nr:MAG: hypothetical protein D6740_12640 [Alphaproteobacteria bacterium]